MMIHTFIPYTNRLILVKLSFAWGNLMFYFTDLIDISHVISLLTVYVMSHVMLHVTYEM